MTLYLLSSSVIPANHNGLWGAVTLCDESARMNLYGSPIISAVGHESTAELMSAVLGIDVPVNRIEVAPKQGDRLLCFKIRGRASEGVVFCRTTIQELGWEWVLLTYHNTIGSAIDAELRAQRRDFEFMASGIR